MRKIIISTALIILICLIYLTLLLQIVNANKIAFGVKVAGFRLEELENQWNQFVQKELIFAYGDKSWPVNLSDLGFQLDSQANIDQAYYISHGSNFFVNSKNQLVALFNPVNLNPAYQIKQETFQDKTNQLFENIEGPAQNATLIFNQETNDYSLQHSTQGTIVDRQQILNQLSEQIKDFSLKIITLELILDQSEVENDEVIQAKEKAQRILTNQPYYLTLENERYTIDKNILIDWIIFVPVKESDSDNLILGFNLDFQKVKKYLDKVALNVDRPMTNAQLETQDNKATLFIPDQPGFEVKRDLTFDNLVENLLANPPIKTTPIIADKALSKIKLWQTNQLGIRDLVGQGVSNFTGSPANRKHNIKTAVAKLNGYILSPDEEFSFINFLG